MKKYIWLLVFFSALILPTFADIDIGPQDPNDVDFMSESNNSMESFQNVTSYWLFIAIWVWLVQILLYHLLIAYGFSLLAKKYAPQHRPIISWIPLYNLNVYMSLNGCDLLWLIALLICIFIPFGGIVSLVIFLYLNYHLAKKLNQSFLSAFFLTLFPAITFPVLWCKEQGKSIILPSIFGGLVTLITVAMFVFSTSVNIYLNSWLSQ